MKFLFFNKEKHYISADQARNILMYGFKNMTTEEVLSREIKDLEITIKTRSGEGYRIAAKVFQDWREDLAVGLKNHFTEKGFVTDLYKNPKIPNTILLIIGW